MHLLFLAVLLVPLAMGQASPPANRETNASLVGQAVALSSESFKNLDAGERSFFNLRIGLALEKTDKEESRRRLRLAINESRSAPIQDTTVDASADLSTDQAKINRIYKEHLRQVEMTEAWAIAELLRRGEVELARDFLELRDDSPRGYRKMKYGDVVLLYPPIANSNTHLLAAVTKAILQTDPDTAVQFFATQYPRFEEPVFSPALNLIPSVGGKNRDVLLALITTKTTVLLRGEPSKSVVAHEALADALAREKDAAVVSSLLSIASEYSPSQRWADYPRPLKKILANAFYQYSAAAARFPELKEQEENFNGLFNKVLTDISVQRSDFEKSVLTEDVTRNPARFAEVMKTRNKEFGEQLSAMVKLNQSRRRSVTTSELVGFYQNSTNTLERMAYAMALNEKLYRDTPEDAESYLMKAREDVKKLDDPRTRVYAQSMLYAQGVRRCSPKTLDQLANDVIETTRGELSKRKSDSMSEAVYLSTLLDAFYRTYSQTEPANSLTSIEKLPNDWLKAYLYTTFLFSMTSQLGGIY